MDNIREVEIIQTEWSKNREWNWWASCFKNVREKQQWRKMKQEVRKLRREESEKSFQVTENFWGSGHRRGMWWRVNGKGLGSLGGLQIWRKSINYGTVGGLHICGSVITNQESKGVRRRCLVGKSQRTGGDISHWEKLGAGFPLI